MGTVTNLIPNKLHPRTGEDLKPTIQTLWQDGVTVLTDSLCGGLYNKDTEPTSPTFGKYFKWNSSGFYSINRLTTANESNFKKLISDFGSRAQTIVVNSIIPITGNYTIPININIVVESGGGFDISNTFVLKILGEFNAGLYQAFYGLGRPDIQVIEQPVEWYGAKGDYNGWDVATQTYGVPGVGGVVGTDNTAAVQKAIYSSKGRLIFRRAQYWFTGSLRVVAVTKLIGAGSTNGTELIGNNTFTEPLLNCKDYDNVVMYWHHGSVCDLSVRNCAGDGIYLFQPGENTHVDGVMVSDCAGSGMVVKSPIPCNLGSLSFYRNGVAGITYEDCLMPVNTNMVSGDDNNVLIYILRGSPMGNITINAIKAERNNINKFTGLSCRNIILAENCDRTGVIIGGIHYLNQLSAAGLNVIEYKKTDNALPGETIRLDVGNCYGDTTVVPDFAYGYYNSHIGPRIINSEFRGSSIVHKVLNISNTLEPTTNFARENGVAEVVRRLRTYNGGFNSTDIFREYSTGAFEWPTQGVGFNAIESGYLTLAVGTGLSIRNGTWNGEHLKMGTYHFWVESGNVRYKNGVPSSATDGFIFGRSFAVVGIDNTTPVIDASASDKFSRFLTANGNMPAPSNPTNGQIIRFTLGQDGTGSRTLTWDAIYTFPNGDVPILSTLPNSTDFMEFRYNGTSGKWQMHDFLKADRGTNVKTIHGNSIFGSGDLKSPLLGPSAFAIVQATPVVDAALYSNFIWLLSASGATVPAPTTPTSGQVIKFRIKQDTTGSRTLNWDAIYAFPKAEAPALSKTINAVDYFEFVYTGDGPKWELTSFERGDTPTNILISGTGSPEGVVTATVGHLYTRLDGGANTTLYVKESGTGNTGWIAK